MRREVAQYIYGWSTSSAAGGPEVHHWRKRNRSAVGGWCRGEGGEAKRESPKARDRQKLGIVKDASQPLLLVSPLRGQDERSHRVAQSGDTMVCVVLRSSVPFLGAPACAWWRCRSTPRGQRLVPSSPSRLAAGLCRPPARPPPRGRWRVRVARRRARWRPSRPRRGSGPMCRPCARRERRAFRGYVTAHE